MKIPFKGLVRNTPAGLAQDGELEDMCNVRYKDGAWRPIPDRVAVFDGETLPYTNIFIHSNAGYKHYLGLKADGTFEYFAEDINGDPTELPVPVPITTLSNPTFTQIGNVININDNGLKHLIWYDNAYVLIDSNFDGSQDSTMIGPVKVDLKVDGDADVNGVRKRRLIISKTVPNYSSLSEFNNDLPNRKSIAQALLVKLLAKEHEFGRLNGFCMACTSLELYDGTYILHSNPIFLSKSYDSGTRYDRDGRHYIENQNVFFKDIINFIPTEEYSDENPLTGNDCWSDTTLSYTNFPDLLATITYNSTFAVNQLTIAASGNYLKYKIPVGISNDLKPLVKSVSIFITPEIDLFKNDKVESKKALWTNSSYTIENYYFNPKTNAEIIKELSELKNFYKVHEIPFDDIKTTTENDGWVTIDLKDKLGDSLLTLQPLPIDNYSHHTTLPEVQFVYNSKLHVANYKVELSRGWPYEYFELKETGIGQFGTTLYGATTNKPHWWVEVKIQTQNGTTTVVRHKGIQYGTWERNNYAYTPMLSYPDSRAYEMTLYIARFTQNGTSGYNKTTFPLTASKAFNFAYYISPDLKPIKYIVTGTPSNENPPESNRQQVFQNTLKVSEVNNPFIFPAANTYQVGNGDIIGLATNTVALSTGQFGQFPVYVFCTDGIYGLYVGGAEINYSSSRPVSREVCNNPKSIKAIDTGVIFTTDKGIMVLVGSEVKELSEPLRGGIFDINKLSLFKQALNHVKLTELLPEITKETIHDYIQSAIVGYNYIEREVWFTNPDLSYSYIFSQGAWYKVKQTGSRYIDDYPKQYILNEGKLIDISSEEGTYQQVFALTRPIKMGDVEFKQMLTAVIRGRMLVENIGTAPTIQKKWAGIHVYGSYDGERWVFLGGNEKNGELNDFGTRVERTDCKYFRIAFYGNINNESYINYLELEGKQSILSTKLR